MGLSKQKERVTSNSSFSSTVRAKNQFAGQTIFRTSLQARDFAPVLRALWTVSEAENRQGYRRASKLAVGKRINRIR
jgi:hypothetical protein